MIAAAYVVALAVAVAWLTWGPSVGQLWADTLIADVLATLVIFVVSRTVGNSSCYDAYWSVVPVFLLLYWWLEGDARHAGGPARWRCALLAIVVVIWAVRLTVNWWRSFPGLVHEDWRYPLLRQRAGRLAFLADLFAIHLIPTLQVFLAMVPAYVALTRPDDGLVWLSVVAFVVGLGAVALESAADRQLRLFRRTSEPGQTSTSASGPGRGTRTTSASSCSGCLCSCSASQRHQRTPGGCGWEPLRCSGCSSGRASR